MTDHYDSSGVTTAPANPASGGRHLRGAANCLSANVKSLGVFRSLNTKLLGNPILEANLGIFYD